MVKKTSVIFFAILLIGAIYRFWALGQNPSGVSNDEINYLYSAYSISKTGRDIHGSFLPTNFQLDNSLSPVPVYVVAPFVGMFGLNSFTGRLPFAIAGILSVYLIYLISEKLFRKKSIALIAAFIMSVCPWAVFFSRVAYDGQLALFLGLFATNIYLAKVKKGSTLWSLPVFFLAFYSYHATKIFFSAFIPFLVICYWRDLISRKKELTFYIVGFLLLIASFGYQLKTQNITRQNVLIGNDLVPAAQIIDAEREVNTAPWDMRVLFTNKITYWGRIIKENYLEAFSPQFLLLYGETGGLSALYGVMSHGVIYLLDGLFIIIGSVWLVTERKIRKTAIIIFGWLLLAPLPSAFTLDRSYAMRSIFMIAPLVILTGVGLYQFWISSKYWSKTLSLICRTLVIVTYIYLIASYTYIYFCRYVLYGAEPWFRSSRDMVEYMLKNEANYKQIYLANSGDLLIQLAFYKPIAPQTMRQLYGISKPRIGKIIFLGDCIDTKGKVFDPKTYLPPHTMYIVPTICHKEAKPFKTIKQVDEPLRVIWKFYKN